MRTKDQGIIADILSYVNFINRDVTIIQPVINIVYIYFPNGCSYLSTGNC